MSYITDLFNNYGYIVLFAALTLELIALPTPGETLMIYCGFLVFQGQLNWTISILVAAAGVITGITASYFIGTILEEKFILKYGSFIHMKPEELEKVSKWFTRYGNGLLIVSCFIPGVRHITGYFSGITKIPYKKFAINAYLGAFLWTGVFISLGKVLGPSWEQFHASLKKYLFLGGVIVGILLICIYIYRSYRNRLAEYIRRKLAYLLKIFHSLGRARIAVTGIAVLFIGLVILTAGLIQDLLANEFTKFDTVTAYIITQMFPKEWSPIFRFIQYLTSYPVLILLGAFLLIWILIIGKNRMLEARFLIITVLGGELLEEALRLLFHRSGPSAAAGQIRYTFPGEQSLMALVAYGFAAFLILRHSSRRRVGGFLIPAILIVCILSGISPVFFGSQYPSDAAAGYVFGGAWLSINIVLLEVFRILPEVEEKV